MKKNEVATLVSHLFSPPGVALILFIWLWLKLGGVDGGSQGTVVGIGAYVLIPCLVMLLLKKLRYVSDLYDPRPVHRQRILLAGFFCYLAGHGVLRVTEAPGLLLWCSACFSVGAALVWVINHRWKISIHATGVGGAAVMLLEVSGQWVLPGVAVVALAVAWSRLSLGAHTQSQVLAGFVLGMSPAWAFLSLYQPW